MIQYMFGTNRLRNSSSRNDTHVSSTIELKSTRPTDTGYYTCISNGDTPFLVDKAKKYVYFFGSFINYVLEYFSRTNFTHKTSTKLQHKCSSIPYRWHRPGGKDRLRIIYFCNLSRRPSQHSPMHCYTS